MLIVAASSKAQFPVINFVIRDCENWDIQRMMTFRFGNDCKSRMDGKIIGGSCWQIFYSCHLQHVSGDNQTINIGEMLLKRGSVM
jgi:hypothetical protein